MLRLFVWYSRSEHLGTDISLWVDLSPYRQGFWPIYITHWYIGSELLSLFIQKEQWTIESNSYIAARRRVYLSCNLQQDLHVKNMSSSSAVHCGLFHLLTPYTVSQSVKQESRCGQHSRLDWRTNPAKTIINLPTGAPIYCNAFVICRTWFLLIKNAYYPATP